MDPTALFLMVAPGRGGVPPGPCWLCFFLFFGVGDSLRSNRALFVRVLRVCVCLCLWVLPPPFPPPLFLSRAFVF